MRMRASVSGYGYGWTFGGKVIEHSCMYDVSVYVSMYVSQYVCMYVYE